MPKQVRPRILHCWPILITWPSTATASTRLSKTTQRPLDTSKSHITLAVARLAPANYHYSGGSPGHANWATPARWLWNTNRIKTPPLTGWPNKCHRTQISHVRRTLERTLYGKAKNRVHRSRHHGPA